MGYPPATGLDKTLDITGVFYEYAVFMSPEAESDRAPGTILTSPLAAMNDTPSRTDSQDRLWPAGSTLAYVRPPDSKNRPSPFFTTLLEDRLRMVLPHGRNLWFSSPQGTVLHFSEVLTDGMTLVWNSGDQFFGFAQWVFVHPRCIVGRLSPGIQLNLQGRPDPQSRIEASNLIVHTSPNDQVVLRCLEATDGFRFSIVWTEGHLESAITQSSKLLRIDLAAYYQRSRQGVERFGEFLFPESLEANDRLSAVSRLRGCTYAILNNGLDYLRRPLPKALERPSAGLDLLPMAWSELNPRIAAQIAQTQLRLQKKDGRIPMLGLRPDMIGCGHLPAPPLVIWSLEQLQKRGGVSNPENVFPQLVWYVNWLKSKACTTTADGRPLLNTAPWEEEGGLRLFPESEAWRSTILALELRAYLDLASQLGKAGAPHQEEFAEQLACVDAWLGQTGAPGSGEEALCFLAARGNAAPPQAWKGLKPQADWGIDSFSAPLEQWLIPLLTAKLTTMGNPKLQPWNRWVRDLLGQWAHAMEATGHSSRGPASAMSEATARPAAESKWNAGAIQFWEEMESAPPQTNVLPSPWIAIARGAAVTAQKQKKRTLLPRPPVIPIVPAATPHGEPIAGGRGRAGRKLGRHRQRRPQTITRLVPIALLVAVLAGGIHLLVQNRHREIEPSELAGRALQIAEIYDRPEEALELLAGAPQDHPAILAATAQIYITSLSNPVKALELLEAHPDIPENPEQAPQALLDLYNLARAGSDDGSAEEQGVNRSPALTP